MSHGLPERRDSEKNEQRSLFGGLPSYPNQTGADAPGEILSQPRTELVCGECEQRREGIASYSVLHIIFLFIIIIWRVDTVTKCPACMRAYLIQRLPLSLVMATVLAPLILVWWGVLFIRTLGR